MKTLKIRDLTLRDGQQSSFATRMAQSQIDRVLPYYRDAGFYAMEVWGGAVPDSVMRYLGENPWERLEKIKAAVGDVSLLTALSRGRNVFGYQPYPDKIIEGFCRNSVESGIGIMRIFDALNDVNNIKSTIRYIKRYGGIADCAVCYTTDPTYPPLSLMDRLKGRRNPEPVFTNEYFLDKVMQMVGEGADMITIKDMSGLIPPRKVWELVTLFKEHTGLPIDFHTHCTPGYGLASVVSAISAGADIVDTNIWNFAGGPGAPAIELVWIFCQKMGVTLDLNFDAIAKINEKLKGIREELSAFDSGGSLPRPFNPLTDEIPAEVEEQIARAIRAARAVDEDTLIDACHMIEAHYGFSAPNEVVKKAQIPGGMYTNMVAQLRQLNNEAVLPRAMELIPQVRLDSGLPPLVTPTSQIVGVQAVNCAMDEKQGKEMYTTKSVQFVNMVKGEYGKTPREISPAFREKITGSPIESDFDTSGHTLQPNPVLEDLGGVLLAENEKEELLLELFPAVARNFLTAEKRRRYEESQALRAEESARLVQAETPVTEEELPEKEPVTGFTVNAPMPGRILGFLVKPGDRVTSKTDVFVLEAMKMENNISAEQEGIVKRILMREGDTVQVDSPVIELE